MAGVSGLRLRLFVAGVAALVAATGSARVVYDAGAALVEELTKENPSNTWTDSKGGQWSCGSASASDGTDWQDYTAYTRPSGFRAFGTNGGIPYIAVNSTGTDAADGTLNKGSNMFAAGEMLLHPAAGRQTLLRFTVPEDGRYSVTAFHKLMEEDSTTGYLDGVGLTFRIGAKYWYKAGCETDERKKDHRRQTSLFQSGVLELTRGTVLTFALDNSGGNLFNSDGTKARITIVREDDTGVYDLSHDFTAQLRDGGPTNTICRPGGAMWRIGRTYAATLPQESCTLGGMLLTETMLRDSGLAGLCSPYADPNVNYGNGYAPYLVANTNGTHILGGSAAGKEPAITDSGFYSVADGELLCNLGRTEAKDLVIRFQPPEAGFYKGRIYLRDVNDSWQDGVSATVFQNRTVITNVVFGYEEPGFHYVLLDIPARLLTPGEWIDLVLDCRTRYEGDGTALAVTFFKDPDAPTVHDAGAALRELLPTGTAVNPFTDSHGQAWRYGMRSGAAGDGTFTPYSQFQNSLYDNSGLNAWALNGGKLPRIFVNATGAPAVYQDSQHHPFPLLMPDEIFAHPGPPGDATRAPFIRWIAPSNGLYRAHGLVRDVDSVADPTFNDGVTRCFAVPGSVVDARCVSIDQNQSQNAFAKDRNMRGYEVCDAPYLFLRAGEWIDSVLLHNVQYNNDATFLSFAVTAQADPFAGQAFLNIRFGDEAEGATPRLGWRDELSWTCRAGWAARGVTRADGSRRTNAAVALGAGTEIVTGLAAGAPLQTQGLRAAGPDETKRFTLSGLKPGAEYTLAVYSLTGRWRTDTLAFEANGVTEPAESLTAYGVPDSVQLFRAAADDAGVIACSFTSSVAGQPAVVNAVQVIGDVPDYVALGTVILMR